MHNSHIKLKLRSYKTIILFYNYKNKFENAENKKIILI